MERQPKFSGSGCDEIAGTPEQGKNCSTRQTNLSGKSVQEEGATGQRSVSAKKEVVASRKVGRSLRLGLEKEDNR